MATVNQIADNQVAAAKKAYFDHYFEDRGSGAHPGQTEDSFTFTDPSGKQHKQKTGWTPGDPFDSVTGEDGKPITIFNAWTARDNQQFHPYAQEITAENMMMVGSKYENERMWNLEDASNKAADLQVSLLERIQNAGKTSGSLARKATPKPGSSWQKVA